MDKRQFRPLKKQNGFTRLKFRRNFGGFTIAELLLATSVFSLTLLVALGAFLGVGKLFYKGVSNTQNQELSRQVLNEITTDIQTSASISSFQKPAPNYTYFCLGNNRYTFGRGDDGHPIMVDLAQKPEERSYNVKDNKANFGLLKDVLPGSSACAPPCDSRILGPGPSHCEFNKGDVALDTNNAKELLGNKMRVGDLQINSDTNNPDLYKVDLIIAYGNDNVLDFGSNIQCKVDSGNQQYCAVTTLHTGVFKGVHT